MRVRAVHEIVRTTGRMTTTGDFDANGAAIVRPEQQVIAPGTLFECSGDELTELLEARAVALPRSAEVRLAELQAADAGEEE